MRYKDLADVEAKLGRRAALQAQQQVDAAAVKQISKYRNVHCDSADGQKFDSKLERKVYERLCAEYGKESVIRQVSIPIGEQRIRLDFFVITLRSLDLMAGFFADAKGRMTPEWKAKANHLKDKHGIDVRLIKK